MKKRLLEVAALDQESPLGAPFAPGISEILEDPWIHHDPWQHGVDVGFNPRAPAFELSREREGGMCVHIGVCVEVRTYLHICCYLE